jgi:hypothetical protein
MFTLEADVTRSIYDYHQTRAREEVERAGSATSDCARHAHLELARLHVDRSGMGAVEGRSSCPLDAIPGENTASRVPAAP